MYEQRNGADDERGIYLALLEKKLHRHDSLNGFTGLDAITQQRGFVRSEKVNALWLMRQQFGRQENLLLCREVERWWLKQGQQQIPNAHWLPAVGSIRI